MRNFSLILGLLFFGATLLPAIASSETDAIEQKFTKLAPVAAEGHNFLLLHTEPYRSLDHDASKQHRVGANVKLRCARAAAAMVCQ
jgi:hypothetical protein